MKSRNIEIENRFKEHLKIAVEEKKLRTAEDIKSMMDELNNGILYPLKAVKDGINKYYPKL